MLRIVKMRAQRDFFGSGSINMKKYNRKCIQFHRKLLALVSGKLTFDKYADFESSAYYAKVTFDMYDDSDRCGVHVKS